MLGGMPDRGRRASTLITSAGKGRTLDLEERNKRYLLSMAVRMGLLALVFVVPGWWKLACLIASAVIPVVAVLLANNYEPAPVARDTDVDPGSALALTSGNVIAAQVEKEDEE